MGLFRSTARQARCHYMTAICPNAKDKNVIIIFLVTLFSNGFETITQFNCNNGIMLPATIYQWTIISSFPSSSNKSEISIFAIWFPLVVPPRRRYHSQFASEWDPDLLLYLFRFHLLYHPISSIPGLVFGIDSDLFLFQIK